jgi:hypothetical protein
LKFSGNKANVRLTEIEMPRYKLIALTAPVSSEHEDEYNDWYQSIHLGQVVAIDGIKSAQRFRLAINMGEGEASPYLAIYDIETDDIEGVMREIASRAGTERMIMSEALAPPTAIVYEEFGPPVLGEG